MITVQYNANKGIVHFNQLIIKKEMLYQGGGQG